MIDPGMTDENVIWRFKNGHEKLGEFGERLWSRVFSQCGFLHVSLATLPPLNGKGPRLQGSDDVLPDFEVTAGMERQRVYVDSKCKTRPVLFKLANELRHGIDRRDYEHYDAVAGMHKQKCILGIIELFHENGRDWSGTLLINSLGRLLSPINGFSDQDHMVYWPRHRFFEVGAYRPLQLFALAHGNQPVEPLTKERVTQAFVLRKEDIQSRLW